MADFRSWVTPLSPWALICYSLGTNILLCCQTCMSLSVITGRNEVVAKVIFLHLSVIHSVHRGGGGRGLPQCLLGYLPPSPPEQTPRTRQTPRTPPDQADTPLGGDTPQRPGRSPWTRQTPPDQAAPPDQADPPRSRHSPPDLADTPPGPGRPPLPGKQTAAYG